MEYDVAGVFATFSALVGVDDSYNGALSFVLIGDGRELWNSGAVKKSEAPRPVNVAIAGVKRLVLRAIAAGDAAPAQPQGPGQGRGGFGTQGVWLEAKISGRAAVK